MSRHIYVFSDMDDTLLQTEGKCPPGMPLVEAAVNREGQTLSFHTIEQLHLLDLLQGCTLIPVTGRSLEALERIRTLRFGSYRITSHGALVLDAAGEITSGWTAVLDAEVPRWEGRLNETLADVLECIASQGLDLRARLIQDLGIPVYLSVKGEADQLRRLVNLVGRHWTVQGGNLHHNGHNIAFLPPYACKARAVAHLMETLRAQGEVPLFIGMGDSHSDIPFLRLCHFAITPQDSQIHKESWI